MHTLFAASVVIPTYNRKELVQATLASLARQSLATDCYEVIVVDDGSTQALDTAAFAKSPLHLKVLRQRNAGATTARNTGAAAARGEVLIFVDDDITLNHTALEALLQRVYCEPKVIALGRLVMRPQVSASVYGQLQSRNCTTPELDRETEAVDFTECKTGVLAIRQEDFQDLGGFQDPSGGWPNWDDLDFGYRAHQRGLRFVRSRHAIGEHWDYALKDLATACRRWQAASHSAVRLFETHPALRVQLPMFEDKTPLNWQKDRPRLLARKLARRLAAAQPVVESLERLVALLEQRHPTPFFLEPLYRWVIGSYIFRGYRQGLRDLA